MLALRKKITYRIFPNRFFYLKSKVKIRKIIQSDYFLLNYIMQINFSGHYTDV